MKKLKVSNNTPINLDLTKHIISQKQDRTTCYEKIELFDKHRSEIKF